MEILRQLYDNSSLCEATKAFLHQMVDKNALDELYQGRDARASAEARKVIDKAFMQLEIMFRPIKKNNNKSSR